jgi:acyl-CoA reductase-like NAD-dependent aldehyde dehydrogenase
LSDAQGLASPGGGQWVTPSSTARIDVIDPGTEELFFSVAEAQAADIGRAAGAAREAFDDGPWPRLTHVISVPSEG